LSGLEIAGVDATGDRDLIAALKVSYYRAPTNLDNRNASPV
jgi:hypothetical protein